MPAPAAAIAHDAPMDPSDRVEYITRFSSMLEAGETIQSVEIALYPEAVALGFTILEGEELGPTIINDNSVRIWVEIDEDLRDSAQFDDGALMPVEFTIVTDNDPFRRFQRTMTVEVQHL